MKKIRKILIANRGEIVNRIIRAAQELSIIPVVLYTDEDQGLTYLDTLIQKHRLEGSSILETYLNQQQIIAIAQHAGADAIHPGYGFLSENPEFAELCNASGIAWIGPSPGVMRQMSGKSPARELAIRTGIPVIPAISGTPAEIASQSGQLKFPILIKAVAGGGGRGMRIIRSQDDFAHQIELASAEAGKFFGNPGIFAEQYIENGRHIEVQILGDHHGNVIHLYERDCSVQRRYQKIIEEAPAPNLPETTRAGLLDSAVKLARAAGYDSAGTIEFLVDQEGNHYFIEMNTRIQVEHPVTEMITGIDIVKEQIRVAEGKHLRFTQEKIRTRGHAIECRICAEDYNDHFHPSPGTIGLYVAPEGRGIRVEEAVRTGSEISSRFDSMISKLIVRAPGREGAIERMKKALDHYVIHGPETNLAFQREILSDSIFLEGKCSTHYLTDQAGELIDRIHARRNRVSKEHLGHIYQQASYRLHRRSIKVTQKDPWNGLHGWRQLSQRPLDIEGYTIWINGRDPVGVIDHTPGMLRFILEGHEQTAWYSVLPDNTMILTWQGFNFKVTDPAFTRKLGADGSPETGNGQSTGSRVSAPLPGRIARLLVKPGDAVTKGTSLAVIESMKTENQILALTDGVVGNIVVKEGQQVKSNDLIMDLNTN